MGGPRTLDETMKLVNVNEMSRIMAENSTNQNLTNTDVTDSFSLNLNLPDPTLRFSISGSGVPFSLGRKHCVFKEEDYKMH